jgi:hypothetical protein
VSILPEEVSRTLFTSAQTVAPPEMVASTDEGITVMVPVALTDPQPPIKGILYGKVPTAVGVPLMVIASASHEAVKPAGSPVAVPMPVAPVVAR